MNKNSSVAALFALLLLLSGTVSADSFITGMSQDFNTTNSFIPGGWHYVALNNNGTTAEMSYNPAESRWYYVVEGDGFITNKTDVFGGAGNSGNYTVFYTETTAGGHAGYTWNASANWTSNYTGEARISGWYNRGAFGGTANLTVFVNKSILWSGMMDNASNTTYSFVTDLVVGDYVSMVVTNTTTGSAHLNVTLVVESVGGDPTPTPTPTPTPSTGLRWGTFDSVFGGVLGAVVGNSVLVALLVLLFFIGLAFNLQLSIDAGIVILTPVVWVMAMPLEYGGAGWAPAWVFYVLIMAYAAIFLLGFFRVFRR